MCVRVFVHMEEDLISQLRLSCNVNQAVRPRTKYWLTRVELLNEMAPWNLYLGSYFLLATLICVSLIFPK